LILKSIAGGLRALNFDFQSSLAEKIAALKPGQPAARRAVYDELRESLRQYVRESAPNIPVPTVIARQRELEAAILAIETEARRYDPPPPRVEEPPRRARPAPSPPATKIDPAPAPVAPEPEFEPEKVSESVSATRSTELQVPANEKAAPLDAGALLASAKAFDPVVPETEEPTGADHAADVEGAVEEEVDQDTEEEVAAPRTYFVYAAVAGMALVTIVVIASLFRNEFDRVVPPPPPPPPATAGRVSAQPQAATSELFAGTGFGAAAAVAMKDGNAALARGQYDKAIAAFDDAIRLEPGQAAAYGNRAFAHWSKGQAELAIRDYGEALARDPRNHGIRFNRAVAYNRIGDYEKARADLNEVIRAEPANVAALNSRCWSHALLGNLDDALADCNEALRLAPKDVNALDSRGFVHLKSGRLQRAVSDYDAALRIDPKLATSLYGRGIARIGRGDRAGGSEDVTAARKLEPEIQARFARYGIR
jgi:Flp pilus assembly protein TadD